MDNNNEVRPLENDLKGRIWEETKKTCKIAFPTIFKVTSFGMVVVTQSFVGHIGRVPNNADFIRNGSYDPIIWNSPAFCKWGLGKLFFYTYSFYFKSLFQAYF